MLLILVDLFKKLIMTQVNWIWGGEKATIKYLILADMLRKQIRMLKLLRSRAKYLVLLV